jgi:hypothetical protein
MQFEILTKQMGRFPDVHFKKKRLTVAIHAQFDMKSADEVDHVRNRIEESLTRLKEEGDAKVAYSLSDI